MTQSSLDRAVAVATGESVGRIQRMGFGLVVTPPVFRVTRPKSTSQRRSCSQRSLILVRPQALTAATA